MRILKGVAALLVVSLWVPSPGDLLCEGRRPKTDIREASESTITPAATNAQIDLQGRLDRVFARQQRNGEIAFEGEDSVFFRHPVMATLALEAFRGTRDLAFLQRAHGVLKGYFNYLMVYHDADRDFLIERSCTNESLSDRDIEDVGFNALFALDLLSLSQICLELSMPVDALFWYRGMRVVSSHLVKGSYDPETAFFFSSRTTGSGRDTRVKATSVLPVYFESELGDEISSEVIRRHLLTDAPSSSAARYLRWEFTPEERAMSTHADRLLRTLAMLGALEWTGRGSDARRLAASLPARVAADAPAHLPAVSDELVMYLSGVLGSPGRYSPYPRFQDLVVLDYLVFRKSLLDPEQTAALRKSVGYLRRFLLSESGAADPEVGASDRAVDLDSITVDIRQVYFSVSLLRDKWKQRTLFSNSDRVAIPGFDAYAAISELWSDVLETLQRAENFVATSRSSVDGFDLTATLEKASLGPGEPLPIRFVVSAAHRPTRIRSIVVLREQVVDTLMTSPTPLTISPGDPPREFKYSHPAPRGAESTLVPLSFSAEIRFDDGRRERRHFQKSVYMTRPITCAIRFPSGTTLTNGTVPIEILVTKHLPVGATIRAQWYSPAGLKPAEGRSIEAWMPERTEKASMLMNILVPNPCRPGSFPFTLKMFSNGDEAGSVTSKLFKHYQWLFVGPFPGKRDALDTRYPPEVRVNLFDTYTGALGQLSWQTLPASSYVDDGRISLGSLLPEGSLGFLYTVIETAAARSSTVLFESNVPAIMYVNGESMSRTNGGGASSPERIDVALKAGMNNVLIKTLARTGSRIFFQLGDEEDLMSDEFNNNLWELVDDYQELLNRGRDRGSEDEQVQRRVTITYRDTNATSVSVVGSFNGWSPANSAMRKNKYGEWEVGLFLSPGRYTYRLRIDDTTEIVDPSSPYTEPDGYGGQNSVLYVQ